MNIFALTFIFILLIFDSADTAKRNNHSTTWEGSRFRGIQCTADNRSIEIIHCYIKAYSRTFSAMNVKVRLLKPIDKPIYVQFTSNYQFGAAYREIINTQKQEWCNIMEGSATNPYMKAILKSVRNLSGFESLFRKCPYEGEVELVNASTNALDIYKNFPNGNFRFEITCYKNGIQIFLMRILEELRDPGNLGNVEKAIEKYN